MSRAWTAIRHRRGAGGRQDPYDPNLPVGTPWPVADLPLIIEAPTARTQVTFW